MLYFTHNDLDAVGTELVLRKTNFSITEKWHTNYSDFEDVVDDIINYAKNNNESELIITDLSFAERAGTLENLMKHFKTILHIDHHSYYDKFFDLIEMGNCNYKKIIDTSMCAAKLCLKTFKIQDKYLETVIDIIDIYDCWRVKHPLFDKAQNMNKYFWELGYDNFLNTFSNGIPKDYKETIDKINKTEKETIQKIKDNNLIFRSLKGEKITFVMTFECFNPIMIEENRHGQEFVIGIAEGKVRVRIDNSSGKFADYDLDDLRQKLAGKTTGHPCAYSYKLRGDIINEVKRITDIINNFDFDVPF